MTFVATRFFGRMSASAVAAAVAVSVGCQGTLVGPELNGEWGGEHILVTVTDEGAHLVFDCASGRMSVRPDPDDKGEFDIAGTWTASSPVYRDGQEPDRHPARYRGHIQGRTMRFTITLTDDGLEIGAYQAKLGEEPTLIFCQ